MFWPHQFILLAIYAIQQSNNPTTGNNTSLCQTHELPMMKEMKMYCCTFLLDEWKWAADQASLTCY